jgi:hypothetical protein
MLLQLDDQFKVTCDSSRQNWQLEQLQEVNDKKNGGTKFEWNNIGFHGNSLRSVLLQYRNVSLINDDKLETLNDVLDKLNEIERTIVKVVKQENIKLVSAND